MRNRTQLKENTTHIGEATMAKTNNGTGDQDLAEKAGVIVAKVEKADGPNTEEANGEWFI